MKNLYTDDMSPREKILVIAIFIMMLLSAGVWYAIFDHEKINKDSALLQVSFLDVGQGDAIFIEDPNGNQMLIDGGKDGEVLRQLGKEMSWFDRTLDVVVATHPDADHIGGLDDVISRFKVAHILRSGVQTDKEIQSVFMNLSLQETGTTTIAQRGMKVLLDTKRNIYFEILSPDTDVSQWETNDASIVGKLVYGSTCFMLTGDAPQSIEEHLVVLDTKNVSNDLDCDILKAGHHGSRTSSGERFIQAVTPQFAIVSAGKNNRYGHPHQEVVEVFQKYKIPVFTTFEQGTITFFSDGKTITKK